MIITRDAKQQLIKQIDIFYGIEDFEVVEINSMYETVLESLAITFDCVDNKYYQGG